MSALCVTSCDNGREILLGVLPQSLSLLPLLRLGWRMSSLSTGFSGYVSFLVCEKGLFWDEPEGCLGSRLLIRVHDFLAFNPAIQPVSDMLLGMYGWELVNVLFDMPHKLLPPPSDHSSKTRGTSLLFQSGNLRRDSLLLLLLAQLLELVLETLLLVLLLGLFGFPILVLLERVFPDSLVC